MNPLLYEVYSTELRKQVDRDLAQAHLLSEIKQTRPHRKPVDVRIRFGDGLITLGQRIKATVPVRTATSTTARRSA